jgi:hypothetical protein
MKAIQKTCRYRTWPFNEVVAAKICEEVVKGSTVEEVGSLKGFPPAYMIRYWCRFNPEFKEDMASARKERSEYYHDKLVQIALETNLKSKVAINKLKIDTLKWAAQTGDPAQYGPKQVIEGNPDKPIHFIVDTGIRRQVTVGNTGSGQEGGEAITPLGEQIIELPPESAREIIGEAESYVYADKPPTDGDTESEIGEEIP